MESNLDIITLNVRGLHNKVKRSTLFHWLKTKKFNIICLQETFCTTNLQNSLDHEWDGLIFHGLTNSPHSRGVSILFGKNFTPVIINVCTGDDGRKILINFEYQGQKYTVVNVYAPNNTTPRRAFFRHIQQWIRNNSVNENCIAVCGDFNCALEGIDRLNAANDASRGSLKDLLNYLNLEDTYRISNKNKPGYTYSNKRGNIQSRIDHIFCSDYLNDLIKKSYILNAPKIPDHKAVITSFKPSLTHGNGYWKLNTSFLEDESYKENIIKLINNVKTEYEDSLNKRDLWDLCKIEIKDFSISWAKKHRGMAKKGIKCLEEELEDIEKQILLNPQHSLALNPRLIEVKTAIGEYYYNESKGAQIRSKAKWVEDGETNLKYFKSLEAKHHTNNIISHLKSDNGKTVYTNEEILKEGVAFYTRLYSEQNIDENEIMNYIDDTDLERTLNIDESTLCEGEITAFECKQAIDNMQSNKSPGYDGLPVEFYKCFWNIVKDMLIESFKEAFVNGKLADSHKQAIITLIFKKGDRDKLKNYRPISLSNTDYKILAFVLAKRMQQVIGLLISPEQTACIKDRYIGENIRLLLDIMELKKHKAEPGILLFLDFEKAFDSVNWNFMKKCLKVFGFGAHFCRWIEIIYTDPKAFIKINGYVSSAITLFRSIKQGCPISALLFILCSEILSKRIKHAEHLQGLHLPNTLERIKIMQYADDTCIFLRDLQEIVPCLNIIEQFSNVSGLKLNIDKTEGMCIGSLEGHIPNINILKWPKTPVRYLGIYIGNSNSSHECHRLNWINKLDKMQKLLDSWRTRKITIQGRITIIKCLAMSKIIYTASLLPIPEGIIKVTTKIIYKFVWGPRDKIQRRVMINSFCNGGLQMVDVESQFYALKAVWITRILQAENCFWSILPKYHIHKVIRDSEACLAMNFINNNQMPILKTLPMFYQQCLIGFCKSNNNDISCKSDLFNQIIWGNQNFTINGKCLHSITFIDSDILYIRDVVDPNGNINENMYNKLRNKREYIFITEQIMCALIPYKNYRFAQNDLIQDKEPMRKEDFIGKKSKDFYIKLIKNKCIPPKMTNTWCQEFNIQEINWKEIYEQKLKTALDARMSEFNFKILMNILATRLNLFRWQKATSPLCIYCYNIVQNTKHMLWECPSVSNMWISVGQILNIDITWQHIVTGYQLNKTLNPIITLIAYTVYKKFQKEKEYTVMQYDDINVYMKSEIKYRKKVYDMCLKKPLYQSVKDILDMLEQQL
jgi:exonuclease III